MCDALDLAGAPDSLLADLERAAVTNVKRVLRPDAAARPTGRRLPRHAACWHFSRPRPSGTPSAFDENVRKDSPARTSLALASMTAAGATSNPYELAARAAAEVARWSGAPPHDVAIVLGSGWQGVADGLGGTEMERATADLPGFVAPTVAGHHGQLRSLRAGKHRVLLLIGRTHLYEGRSPAEVVHPVRTAVIAGARVVILTNAAGGLDPAMKPGQAVLIRDHINLMGASPLSGPAPPPGYRGRFIDLTELYPANLRALAKQVDPTLTEGVYAALGGPHYETPAEGRDAAASRRGPGRDVHGTRGDCCPPSGGVGSGHLACHKPTRPE